MLFIRKFFFDICFSVKFFSVKNTFEGIYIYPLPLSMHDDFVLYLRPSVTNLLTFPIIEVFRK